MRKLTLYLSLLIFALAVPAAALAQSGLDQYQESVPGAGGSNGGESSGGGSGDSGGSSGSASGGSIGASPGGEYIPGSGDGSSSGVGGSNDFGSGGSGSDTGVPTPDPSDAGIASAIGEGGPMATLAGGLVMAAAGDLAGEGTTSSASVSDSESGGIGIWLPVVLGASLLAAIGVFAYRRMRAGGPATA